MNPTMAEARSEITEVARFESLEKLRRFASPKVLVVSGGSGSGKSTLTNMLIQKHPERFHQVTRCSTRPIREKDSNEIDVHRLVSDPTFSSLSHRIFGVTTPYNYRYGFLDDDLATASRSGKTWIVNCMIQFGDIMTIWDNIQVTTVAIVPVQLNRGSANLVEIKKILKDRITCRDTNISEKEMDARVNKAAYDLQFVLKNADEVVVNEDASSIFDVYSEFEQACLKRCVTH